MQRRATNQARPTEAPPIVNEVLRSAGQPLDANTRASMEPRFGHDFSRVRIHSDERAAESARAVNALAYTVGRDVVFGMQQYRPETREGRRLLAHELTHVVQQGGGAISSPALLRLNPPGDRFEQEAELVANALMVTQIKSLPRIVDAGSPIRLSLKPPSLQRTAKFVDGSVSEEFNLAERFVIGQLYAGNTDFVLNGTPFTAGTKFETERNALNTPGIGSASRKEGKGVDCWFDSVPHNVGSYEMKVLKSGRWKYDTTKAKMAALFPALRACQKAGDGYSTFIVKENEDLRKRVRIHEEHHVDDYKTIFKDVLVHWDNKVTEAQKNRRKMVGTDFDDCQKKLYLASVGPKQTPNDIVASIITNINTKAKAFHDTPAGRKVKIFNVEAGEDCNTVKAEAE